MRKNIGKLGGVLVAAAIALLAGMVERGHAFGSEGTAVDSSAACANASPKPYSALGCDLCHASDRGATTPQKSAAGAGNYGFFCPTANAGPAQTRAEGTAVSLSGTNSTGEITTYAWTQTAGTAVALSNASTATAGFTAPQVGAGGASLGFQLTVSRTTGYAATTVVSSSASTSVNVTDVAAQNLPPVANAGPTQTVASGAPVTLNGSNSSDPEGGSLTYAWTQTAGTAVALSNAASANPSFTSPAGGSFTFRLTVTDNGGLTASSTTIVNVTQVNVPPTANAGATQTVGEGAAVTLNGSNSSDTDGTIASYAWTQTAGTAVTLSNPAGASPSFTAPTVGASGASLTFRLTVTDNGGLTATATTSVNVTDVPAQNLPHVANAGPTQTVSQGAAVTLDGSNSSDPDGTIASYLWAQTGGASVTLSNPAAAKPTFTAPSTGPLTFRLTVTDDGGLSASATTVVNVSAANNTAPTASAGQDQTVAEGALVTLDGSGSSDADGTIASYLWSQTGGPAATLSNAATAKPTFTAPAVGDPGAALTFQLTVTDNGGLSATDTTIVNISNVYQAPVANAGSNQSVATGATVTLDGSGSSAPEGTIAAYLWAQTAGPSVTLSDPAAVKPTFTAPSAAGSLTFKLTVTDDAGLSASSTVTVTVTVTGGGTSTGTKKSVQLAPDFPSPEAVGGVVTFVATPSGPAVPYQYKFSIRRGGGSWSVRQKYSPNTSWTWNTKGLRAGTYSIRVDMRAVGSKKAYEARKSVKYVLSVPVRDDDDDDDDDEEDDD